MNVLLALALLLQESPEAAFKKVEAVVEDAKSLKMLFTLIAASEPDVTNRGTFSVEGDSKARLSADLKSKGGERLVISTELEGKKLKSALAGHELQLQVDGGAARSNFNMYLSRLGLSAGAMFEHGFWSGANGRRQGHPITIDLKQMFGVSNFVDLGEGKGGTRILSYEFTTAFKPCPFRWAKIWYDTNSYRIRRREARWESGGREETIIEEYEYEGEAAGGGGGKVAPAPAPVRTEAEQDIRFIQARIVVAEEHLKNGRKQKAVDVLEDLVLSFPRHALIPEVKRLLEAAKKS
ncbi:MAG TPA: hypothetical protein VM222_04235 [Planctomycetota bacterium]|nr:hypothetical protein [Planctomycetota bacterium]